MQLDFPAADRSLHPTTPWTWALSTSKRFLILSWILATSLLILAAFVINPSVEAQELVLIKRLRSIDSAQLQGLMLAMHWIQTPLLVLVALVALAFPVVRRQWRLVGESAALLIGAAPLNFTLKTAFHRTRPALEPLVSAHGFGFPSGHTLSAAIVVGWALCMTLRSSLAWSLRLCLGFALMGIVALVGLSRMYLGAHYFSDIVASCIVSACWISLCLAYCDTLRSRSSSA
ncbi:phosphatase PAP2 family protein [Comamonas piscis]|uniref:Phosphatase PAP2 family protein n=1 Tax=Comamonas piscis TaxID=1562974 RepID=A0A7G5ELK0_9BURK|nr:phosphatase PAP2 family protein [Comamonas piscis]QMV74875.1 phosphatase PAP2 family protein [Comamonas piscis]WSO33351.1 phosphatase PAP2 family protein [Comamonas piscis]